MGLMSSDPKIYQTMTWKGVGGTYDREDYYSLLSPLTGAGLHWDPRSLNLKQNGEPAFTADTPWCHAKGTPQKHCNLDHHLTFNTYGIIPPRCLNCWKVVVTPKTFKQLMELEQIEKRLQVPSKCGIELRDYTPKFYGGYFYNNSLEEGRARYEQVRKAVNEEMTGGKKVDVILKRACTEFEMIKGPSLYWHNTAEEERILDIIESHVDVPRVNAEQPELVKRFVRKKWFLWAHMNGDMTYKKFNGGEALFPGYVKYHEGDIDDVKADLATCQASAKSGCTPEMAVEFQAEAQKFADKYKIDNTGALIHMLGASKTNELELRKFNPILSGEGDTTQVVEEPSDE